MGHLVIIGIGQYLRGDDAVGVQVVQQWAVGHPETLSSGQVKVVYAPLAGLDLLDLISGYEKAVLVDAVLGGPCTSPGSLLYLSPEDLSSFTYGTGSAHGWGVAETLELGRTLGREDLPEEILILGIMGKQVEIGAGLSPEVTASLPAAVTALDRLVKTSSILESI